MKRSGVSPTRWTVRSGGKGEARRSRVLRHAWTCAGAFNRKRSGHMRRPPGRKWPGPFTNEVLTPRRRLRGASPAYAAGVDWQVRDCYAGRQSLRRRGRGGFVTSLRDVRASDRRHRHTKGQARSSRVMRHWGAMQPTSWTHQVRNALQIREPSCFSSPSFLFLARKEMEAENAAAMEASCRSEHRLVSCFDGCPGRCACLGVERCDAT